MVELNEHGWLEGYNDGVATRQKPAVEREVPPCPVCGGTLHLDWVFVTPNEEYQARYGDLWLPGRVECEHGCDLVRRERMHYGQSASRSVGAPGTLLRCSCGDETVVLDMAEAAAWRDTHKPPEPR